jgi:hypothetical protein
MAMRDGAATRYTFGSVMSLFTPRNDDKTTPAADNIVGGIGPFDYSGYVDDTAIPFTVKIDSESAIELEVDLSGASAIGAVTPTELAAALDAAFAGEMPALDLDASVDSAGRIKIATTLTTDVPTRIQVYGEGAKTAMFGQGFGMKIVKMDTERTVTVSPLVKESETITTTDANGLDTELVTDGYRKGATVSFVDTADDWELLTLMKGGSINADGEYEAQLPGESFVSFIAEFYAEQYRKGTNNQGDQTGYIRYLHRNCKGAPSGDSTMERGWQDQNYTFTGVPYTDPSDDTMYADLAKAPLTVEEYEALDLANV